MQSYTTFTKMDSNKLVTVVAILLFICGCGFLLIGPIENYFIRQDGIRINQKIINSLAPAYEGPVAMNLGIPEKVSMPRLGIELDVKEGNYNSLEQTWTIDKQNAFNMTISSTPLIYAHNKDYLFGKLSGAVENESLFIKNKAGQTLFFKQTGSFIVTPIDSDFINVNKPNTIYLMTCTGKFDELRHIFAYKYIGTADFTSAKTVGAL